MSKKIDQKQERPAAGAQTTGKQHPEEAWSSQDASQRHTTTAGDSQADSDAEYGNRALHKVAPTPNPSVGRGATEISNTEKSS